MVITDNEPPPSMDHPDTRLTLIWYSYPEKFITRSKEWTCWQLGQNAYLLPKTKRAIVAHSQAEIGG